MCSVTSRAPAARHRFRAAGAALFAAACVLAASGCSVDVSTDPDDRGVHVRVVDKPARTGEPASPPRPDGHRIRAALTGGPPVTVILPAHWHRGDNTLGGQSLFGPSDDSRVLPHVSIEADTDDYWSDPEGKLADFRRTERHAQDVRILTSRRASAGKLRLQRFSEIWSAETSGKVYVVKVLVALRYHGTLHTVAVRGSTGAGRPRGLIDAVVGSVKVDGIPITAVMQS